MDRLRIGVLGPADIAKRRMIPALVASDMCEYVGVAVATTDERGEVSTPDAASGAYKKGLQKAEAIRDEFGGVIFEGFDSLLSSSEADAIYIALPPYLHARWGEAVLRAGKHLLMEKPFTVSFDETSKLIDIAKQFGLAVIENFGFVYHPQIKKVMEIIDSGSIGEVRLIRTNFGFPHRGPDDFRYKKELGGGAVLDCGCYTLKLATLLLGEEMRIAGHELFRQDDGLDISGTITALGNTGIPAQLSFGMDQQYCCNLEIWGTKGSIISPRIFTAPAGYEVELIVTRGMETEKVIVEGADQFALVAEKLAELTDDRAGRSAMYNRILAQSRFVEKILEK